MRRALERVAAKWEAELREGRYCGPSQITWAQFRERYETEKLPSVAKGTEARAIAVMNLVETYLNSTKVEDLTSEMISIFQTKLRSARQKDATTTGKTPMPSATSFGVTILEMVALPGTEDRTSNLIGTKRRMQTTRNQAVKERRARGSNPQPVSRHDISSVAASHSLTLRTRSGRGEPARILADQTARCKAELASVFAWLWIRDARAEQATAAPQPTS
jgi:hypothetical protein